MAKSRGFLGRVRTAIVGEMLDGLGRLGGPKAPFDGLQHEIANLRTADPRAADFTLGCQ